MVILIRVIVFFVEVGIFMIKKRVLGNSKIGRRFQITVPKEVREIFLFKEGDIVLFIKENGKLTLTKSSI